MVGPNLPMDVQLNVDASAGPFADLMHQWMDVVSATVRPQFRAGLEAGADGGLPGQPFGTLEVCARRALEGPWSPDGLAWLGETLRRELPSRTRLWFGVRDVSGYQAGQVLDINARIDAEESPGWLTLAGHPLERDLLDPAGGAEEQRRWLDALFQFADRTNPGFGHISPYYDGGTTALEGAVPPAGRPFVARYQEYAVNECRSYLRGYSWVTIVAQELLPKLGGVERLVESKAFADVRPLAAGGVWLQATADYRNYDDAAIELVFEAVAPALRPGLPRWTEPHAGEHPYRLAFRDAAELGAR
ncbi:hypothetical protein [Dactylosporangium sp. NPDC049140]|uniref:hypothetical protein n=1 Tax=Dactylosporangium sp. NPDC049140 TaxID=3155647 RepID=UPI0034034AAB